MRAVGGPDGEPDGADERVSDPGRGEGLGDATHEMPALLFTFQRRAEPMTF